MTREHGVSNAEVDEAIKEIRNTARYLIDEAIVDFGGREERKELSEEFGAKLRATREETGESLNSFAERVDLDPSHLSRIERGLINPSLKTVYTITEGLDIPTFDALSESGYLDIDQERITEDELEIFKLAVNTKLIRIH